MSHSLVRPILTNVFEAVIGGMRELEYPFPILNEFRTRVSQIYFNHEIQPN